MSSTESTPTSSFAPSPPLPPLPSPPRWRGAQRSLLVVVLCALAAVGATACNPLPRLPGAAPGGTAADCRDIPWGSGAKHADRLSIAPIVRVRAGSHRCFDRFVIDLRSQPAAGWTVRYHAVTHPGSGAPLPVRGGASLEVIIGAAAYDSAGSPTFRPRNRMELVDVTGFDVFRQLAFAGSFEGESTFGIGVRSRLPFRVFAVQDGPQGKLVVDVARRWP